MSAGDAALRLRPRLGGAPDSLVVLLHGVGSSPEAMVELAVGVTSALPRAAIFAPEGFDPFAYEAGEAASKAHHPGQRRGGGGEGAAPGSRPG